MVYILARFSYQINRLFLLESLIDVKLERELRPRTMRCQQKFHGGGTDNEKTT